MATALISCDILFEIARNISAVNDFLAFTAISRAARQFIYNRALTKQFCIVLKNYAASDDNAAYALAEKCSFHVLITEYYFTKPSFTNNGGWYKYTDIIYPLRRNLICISCATLYKWTKNELFTKLCGINYEDDHHFRLCRSCKKIVCLYRLTYDYNTDAFSTHCLNCFAPTRVCQKCGIFPLTYRFQSTCREDVCRICMPIVSAFDNNDNFAVSIRGIMKK